MKHFLILHYGFEKPTSEQMAAWNQWFDSIADKQFDRGGLRNGRKITDSEQRIFHLLKILSPGILLLKQAILMKQKK